MVAELRFSCAFIFFAALVSCGVRGRPQPPLTPAELGRGQPTFKRATPELAFPDVVSPEGVSGQNIETTPEPLPSPRPPAKKSAKPLGESN